MATLAFDGVTKRFDLGSARLGAAALSDLTLEAADGEFLVLVGPSGCGKTTALRLMAGLEDVTEGRLLLGGRVANDLSPRERDIAMVFQSYALYPHLTVRRNIGFGLRVRGVARAELDRRVAEAAELLELTPYLDRKPAQLSGGQRQRVAMGRALVRRPAAFLMDEPLSNLDARLRGAMRAEVARLQALSGTTTLYVTHDQVEAMTMGTRVAVLDRGVLQQVGAPRELYDRPANLFVAGFIGSPPMNLLPGRISAEAGGAVLHAGEAELALPRGLDVEPGQAVVAGLRPEALRPVPEAMAGVLSGTVAFVEDLGATLLVHLDRGGGERLRAVLDASTRLRPGERLHLGIDPGRLHVFDDATGFSARRA